jgi:hypothetical protein
MSLDHGQAKIVLYGAVSEQKKRTMFITARSLKGKHKEK